MEADYWQGRWRRGETGWHRDEVMPLLQKHWPALRAEKGASVLVPLCGKTLDMPWLASAGHKVLGIELAAQAVGEFFAAQGMQATPRATADGLLHTAGDIAILEADAFEVDEATYAHCRHVYDRAALIALPPELRRRYAETLYARLPTGCQALLITLEYPQAQKSGPPFSVTEGEVRALFSPHWEVELLERRDILDQQPSFAAQGVTTLHTAVYRMRKQR
ncbi:thiopurine S-methyltransferase [Lysobacter pythonis]|uniref:Thiopurine S-methyltransferase n=1 Tax=Solilutibacter pythonis TaxID=2483112 RepID=A0A3M2HZ41_9GAMM|nr:thiopurine S-methyltransferase [Lysobacter pythonis]RMH91114.1 thiopurine S-methyltransferase [Lysobacter pythonis]